MTWLSLSWHWLMNTWGGGILSGYLILMGIILLAAWMGRIMHEMGTDRLPLDRKAEKKIKEGVGY